MPATRRAVRWTVILITGIVLGTIVANFRHNIDGNIERFIFGASCEGVAVGYGVGNGHFSCDVTDRPADDPWAWHFGTIYAAGWWMAWVPWWVVCVAWACVAVPVLYFTRRRPDPAKAFPVEIQQQ